MVSMRTDGVVARSREEAVREVRSLVVLAPDDTGQRRVEGGGVEDVSGVSVERREGMMASASEVKTDLMKPFVKLRREKHVKIQSEAFILLII